MEFGVLEFVVTVIVEFVADLLVLEQSILFSSILLQLKNDDFNFLIFSFGLSVGPVFRIEFLTVPSVMSA